MIQTGFDSRIKVQDIIESQLPSFILEESPNASEFLKQYYISQEYQSGPTDIVDNLDQYLKLDNLTPEVVVDSTTLSADISESDTIISVSSTKGFPNQYGLLKIDDEIITYTSIEDNTFVGCVRGFSGITNYHHTLDQQELIFSTSTSESHTSGSSIQNLSSLFLKEFYKKLKYTFAPGFEDITFVEDLDVGNFLKRIKDFYASKGTEESIKILFNVIFGETPKVINLEEYLIKPSSSNYVRREVVIAELITGNPLNIEGQTLFKNGDTSTSAPISSVESFTKKGKQFYKLELFIGYDDKSLIEGNFIATPNTKVLESVSVGSSVVSVDSTIGFSDSGTLFSGTNTITYTEKSVNQFFGCSGIVSPIDATDNIRSDDTYFSYENGDINKKVEFIIFNVISGFVQDDNGRGIYENDPITVKSPGDKINNTGKNFKEIFANSWIYNTRSRYQITDNSTFKLGSKIEKSSLKIGDEIEILDRNTENVISTNSYINSIDESANTISVGNGTTLASDQLYDVRRKLNKSKSSSVPFEYGDNSIISDVLNVYSEKNEYVYVASNSLPSQENDTISYRTNIELEISSVGISTTDNFSDYDALNQVYTSFFVTSVPFFNGDRVYYLPENESLIGLEEGSYYIEVLSGNRFRIYASPYLIGTSNYITFNYSDENNIGNHTFVLYSQRSLEIGNENLLKKFPLEKNIKKGSGEETTPGKVGMLINGVEILNYKSKDLIYYGPLSSSNVISGGEDYDVINPPQIEVGSYLGVGTTAKIQPVISGSFEKIYVDSQDYDIENIVSINISGGNGSGVNIEPVLKKKFRSVSFDSKEFSNGGGVSTTTNQIQFLTDHNFIDGQEIIYTPPGNNFISIGTNLASSSSVPFGASFYVQVDNNSTITLYNSLSDQQSQTNPVGIYSGSLGTHKFTSSKSKNQLDSIKILDGGSGYTNRKLIVEPSGISTFNDTITFKNHGFNDGEIIEYEYETSAISGISTNNQHYVLKVSDDTFRLCDAGIGGTNIENYNRKNYTKLESTGSGYQYFKYPEISVSIKYSPVGFGSTTQVYQDLITTPVVKGSIIDSYLYEKGTGYGSTIINFQKKPIISIKNGKDADLSPVVINGFIENVIIGFRGNEYYSVPNLIVSDSSGSGTGAELRAIVTNNQITDVKIINPGIGYSASSTKIKVVPSGKNSIIDVDVRKLTINDSNVRFSSGESLTEGTDKLQYSVVNYFERLRNSFGDTGNLSGIIGWAYDGNPIYGPKGKSDPEDTSSALKTLESGYTLDVSNVVDRPAGFSDGHFVEDYVFDNSGDLDEHNGRYEKNDDFPNGIYAYHATLDSSNSPEFPYFIGNKYNSKFIEQNLNQSYDFNNSNVLRNTFPYKVSEKNADYDFIDELQDILDQKIKIKSSSSGFIDNISIIGSGDNYKIDDKLEFNNNGTSGSGLDAVISSIKGKTITRIDTNSEFFEDSTFSWNSPNQIKISILPQHNLSSLDYVSISGFSTNLSKLNGFYEIQVPSVANGRCLSSITSAPAGLTTEIYVSPIPEQISVGSSIGIGTETMKVLGIFRNEDILRVIRGSSGVSHNLGTAVSFLPDSFTITESVDKFDSRVDNKVYFNPKESVGISTISGVGYSTSFIFGQINVTRDIPSRSIYIENHPFTTNQLITYTSVGAGITVSTDGINTFDLPSSLYVVNKNPNLIGIKTQINSSEVFFHTNGDDNDEYLFESNYTQILGDVQKDQITVSVSTSHSLQVGDTVKLNVEPNLSVGIGTSTAVRVLYKSEIDAIVINPIGFNSTGINTTTNEITITDHGLETGDKVYYEDDILLTQSEYYIFKVNRNKINLCETYIDSQQNPPTIVSFASTGSSSQTLSLINPEINPIENNNLVFDLSDTSLSGYNLKFYCENDFKNEFVSVATTSGFTISGVGTVGVSSTASLTLEYNSILPNDLYYVLEKTGSLSGYDNTVQNYSKISYEGSGYNGSYSISGIGTTTFTINSNKTPEKLSYSPSECDTLEYTTTSTNAEGPVNTIDILSTGVGYKKLPTLQGTNSDSGKDLIISTESSTIGAQREIKVINNRFTYSIDKTIRPETLLPSFIETKNSNTLDTVTVISGGSGYISAPDVVLVDQETGNVVGDGLYESVLAGQKIQSINIINEPKGLPDNSVKIITINNTNGVTVEQVQSSNTGIFTCLITTPTLGFPIDKFSIGDQVYVEGIQKFSSDGTGFNSEDYDYNFLTVSGYDNGGALVAVTFDVSEITTNTGIAKTIQDYSGYLINSTIYPSFEVTQKVSEFLVGETISSNQIERDLKVVDSDKNNLKLIGTYELSDGEILVGNESRNRATVKSIAINSGLYDVNYSNVDDIGWSDDVGKLSEDYQVTPNNDYYQNLSYSVKSSVTYKDQQSPVENLVHTSGLKNFADTELSVESGIGSVTVNNSSDILYFLIDDKRVDAINNFDNVYDIDVVASKSNFLQLQNKRLTDYVELIGNNALRIDDISNLFSNFESENTEYLNIEEIDDKSYYNYLIRVTDSSNTKIQLTDITILSNSNGSVIVENESIVNVGSTDIHLVGEQHGSFEIIENEFEENILRFIPDDPFNTDYDLKIIRQIFNTSSAGVGTTSIGFINLSGKVNVESTGIGSTTIIELDPNEFESLYINSQVINESNEDINYVRLYISHDGTNTFISEYYIDSILSKTFSGNSIGTFYSNITGGILSIYHENDSSSPITIRSNIVGFGNTFVGIGTYRYILDGQIEGNERSAVYESNYYSTVSAASTTIQVLDRGIFNASKCIVEVSAGSTKALHQVMMIYDQNDVYTQQLPFLSVSGIGTFDGASGIGTFGGEISGNNLLLNFYPDANQTGQIDIEVLSKSLYSDLDVVNEPEELVYGPVTELVDEKFYNSINGERINRFDFEMTSDGIPIFSKTFNPDSVSLAATTGVFTIQDHFFSNNEELIYTPGSSFTGIAASAMRYTATDELPSTVYVVKLSEDSFQISTTRSGAAVTFTSLGGGNAHRFTMSERNTKTIITIDDLVQYPIRSTKISHTLDGNVGGGITSSTEIFSLSGISTINPADILRIDDEYMRVVNVGFGTTNIGPISQDGTETLVKVDRGFVGSSATSHTDSTLVRIYKGAYNIVDNKIHFADSPRGNPQIEKTKLNLDFETSDFTGRVFLRSDYSNNKIYDDISDEFTGIGRTFDLTVGGANTTGIGTIGGSGLVFINSIYQSPKTDNNPNRFNYEINEDLVSGVSTVVFSGITKFDDPAAYVTSDIDINVNEIPRGGIIVSYGSTPGLGFAPLVGSSVTAVVSAGSIVSVGLGTTDNLGSGYNGLVSIGISVYEEGHTGNVADISANIGVGGTLSFIINDGGTGYNNPQIFVSDPSYENLPVIGVSRLGVGATTETGIGLLVDVEVGGSTGIGSTLFEVTDFKISRNGYSFQRGDVFKPVGLVTDKSLSSPLSDFTITVVDTYSDNFAAWEFGKLDYIDSVSNYQDGKRIRFPLYYNSELISFEPRNGAPVEDNLDNLLIIFINGILQDPGVNYYFEGGTSFVFATAPKPEDNVQIYFYRGSDGDTVVFDDIVETLKVGDDVQVIQNNKYPETVDQGERVIYDLSFSNKFQTNLYGGVGIDDENIEKPLTWIKQKAGKIINEEYVSKTRDSIEALVFPTAKIIRDFSDTDNQIFVDNAQFFRYEFNNLDIDGGENFNALVINGISTSAQDSIELVRDFNDVDGWSGIITGITTVPGTGGNPLALRFEIQHIEEFPYSSEFQVSSGISTGYPIYIFDTRIGSGVTSINDSDSAIVGIGTNFLDNVYYISDWSYTSNANKIGVITCNVKSDSNIIGLSSIGNVSNPVGKYSWGRLSNNSAGLTRPNPISIGVSGNIVSGLSTYPTIQRRGGINIRNTGALTKEIDL